MDTTSPTPFGPTPAPTNTAPTNTPPTNTAPTNTAPTGATAPDAPRTDAPPTGAPTYAPPDPTSPLPPGAPPARRLIRPRNGRMIGGVCASLADYFGVDVLLVRVAAVVLALSGGAGVAGYLALWVLTPSSDGPAPADREQPLFASGPRSRRALRLVAAAVLAVVAISLLATLKAVLFPVVAVVALIAALVVGGRWWRGLLAAVLFLVALLIAGVAAGPHLGSRTIAVNRAGDIGAAYGAPTGNVHVDLRGLVLDRDRRTAIWVGSGDIEVDVPASLPVHVDGRTGAGRVTVFDRTASGPGASVISDAGPSAPGQPRLEIDAVAGSGRVLVRSVG